MKRISLILLVVLFVGCESKKIFPPPTIEVQRLDTASNTGMTVYFRHFLRDSNGTTYVQLDSPEEIAAFREQVDFLIKRLEEGDVRMNVHEPAVKK